MGQFLDKPITEKITVSGEGSGIKYGGSAMQGWRMEMEDAHVCNTDNFLKNCAFFGVFDGHAGNKVSLQCADKLLDCIREKMLAASVVDSIEQLDEESIKKVFSESFIKMDDELRAGISGEDRSGTTAITVMVSPTHIIWANCGDSRGFLCRDGEVVFATIDHKPYNDIEKERIERAGGTVMMQRVNGSLAVSRALGDFEYKRTSNLEPAEQMVSPVPDTTVLEVNGKDQFLFLACDGIFDVMSNDEVKDFIVHRLALKDKLEDICSELLDLCLNKNSRDNMSAVLVTFPAAPKVSEEAIAEDKKLQEEAKTEVLKKLNEFVESAKDSLDLDEPYIMQNLTESLPSKYEVTLKRPWICEQLQELRKGKFEDPDSQDFPQSNPHYEPNDVNFGEVSEEKSAVDDSEKQ